ncbi:uncharacterized protein HGUI_02106 [Hanseniaspora guilliermondii]|uniref:Uncharacterized protein n=1 Tax=Hanseniaspora guilliermondii TaxID=56406 RepID=A0A1L0B0H5_9ASCO|nr:uncharacterized protein HGUI_02106 [Hanseniaspora guilliermondii]
MELLDERQDFTRSHKRYRKLIEKCENIIESIFRSITSKKLIYLCFPSETVMNFEEELVLMFENIRQNLKGLNRDIVLTGLTEAAGLEERLNSLDEVIAIAIHKSEMLKDIVDKESWESPRVQRIMEEEIFDPVLMKTSDFSRSDQHHLLVSTLIPELQKRNAFVQDKVRALEEEAIKNINILTDKSMKINQSIVDSISKYESSSPEYIASVNQLRKAAVSFIENELDFDVSQLQ